MVQSLQWGGHIAVKKRVHKIFSEWEKITTGVPQDSILGPILFKSFKTTFFFSFQTLP